MGGRSLKVKLKGMKQLTKSVANDEGLPASPSAVISAHCPTGRVTHGIISRQTWHYSTQDQEDYAHNSDTRHFVCERVGVALE